MIAPLLLGIALVATPPSDAKPPVAKPAAPTTKATTGKKAKPAPAQPAKPAPAAAAEPAAAKAPESPPEKTPAPAPEPPAAKPMDPAVKSAVDRMQRFYEETKDFEARFRQTYSYKSFGRKTEARGRVRFLKTGASMRWDYLDKAGTPEKVFVVAGNKVYAYDKDAKQLTVSGINTERLSASITFLWGQGKLEREFNIEKATRPDLKDGIALELTPKTPDPRFQKVFFLIDPTTYSVKESIVVDPDGSENRMAFADVKTNAGFGTEAFKIDPPSDTQIIRMDQ